MEREEEEPDEKKGPKLVHVFHAPKVDGTAMFMGANLKNLMMTLYYDGLDLAQFMEQFVVREQAYLALAEVLVDPYDEETHEERPADLEAELFWIVHDTLEQHRRRQREETARIAPSMPCTTRAGVVEVDDYSAIFAYYLRCLPHLCLDENSRVDCIELEQCQATPHKGERNRWTPEPRLVTLHRTAGIFNAPDCTLLPHIWLDLNLDTSALELVSGKWPREWGEFNIEFLMEDRPANPRYFAGGAGTRLDQICVDPNNRSAGWRQWVHGDCVGITLRKHLPRLPISVTHAWPGRTFFVLLTWDDRRNPELCLNNGKRRRVERCVYGLHTHEPLLDGSESFSTTGSSCEEEGV